ncbi:MAG: TIGR04255 family protein [Hyphomonadaceae bacterium]
MTNPTLPTPLSGAPPTEVPLPHAPLIRVIAQIRFPRLLAIRSANNVSRLQETIRGKYPVLDEETVRNVVIGPAGAPTVKDDTIWRFHSKDRDWRVSLGDSFVALETKKYTSRADFHARLKVVLSAVEETFRPQEATRIGVRYIDRVEGDLVGRISELIKPNVLGISTEPLGEIAHHVWAQSLFPTEEGALIQARWGKLPPNESADPETIEPIDQPSWVLDIDMYSGDVRPFTADHLGSLATKFSERTYTVFRWMITNEFLRVYGGAV